LNMQSSRLIIVLAFPVATVNGFFFQKPAAVRSPLLPELTELIEQSKNGVDTSLDEDVRTLMTQIGESRKGDQRLALPGQWELVYTTEKEVNFFRTSWPFAKVSSITQNLDPYTTEIINNSISFEGGGEFLVTGEVFPVDGDSEYDRVAFKFEGAVAKGWGKELKLPPVGAGWFDTMFCDEEYRLSQDSRGDWSVFKRLN
jgi:hypothetical protein